MCDTSFPQMTAERNSWTAVLKLSYSVRRKAQALKLKIPYSYTDLVTVFSAAKVISAAQFSLV